MRRQIDAPMETLMWAGILAAFMGLMLLVDALWRPRLRKEAEEEAARLGFQLATLAELPARGFEAMPVFQRGGRAYALYHGRTDGRLTVVCRYVVHGRRGSSMRTYTVACFHVGTALPVEFFEREDAGWRVESVKGWLGVYKGSRPVEAAELPAFLNDAWAMCAQFLAPR
jgi:hypothetical protein